MTDTLDTFILTDKRAAQQWWINRRARNEQARGGPRYNWILSCLPAPPAKVLEIGCQTGGFTLPLLQQGYRVTAVDIVPGNLSGIVAAASAMRSPPLWDPDRDMSRLETVLCFAEDLTYDSKFDAVLLCEVLVHVADDELVLGNAITATNTDSPLVNGGKTIVTVPYSDLYKGEEHARYYSTNSFKRLVSSVAGDAKTVRFTTLRSGDRSVHTLCAEITERK